MKSLSRVRLLATPWTAAYQAPPSMGFSRQMYCSGVPLPSLISFLYCPAILVLELQSIRNEYPIILPPSAQLPPASASLSAPALLHRSPQSNDTHTHTHTHPKPKLHQSICWRKLLCRMKTTRDMLTKERKSKHQQDAVGHERDIFSPEPEAEGM